jgi:ATP-binding cassette subfamily B protein
MIRTFVAYYKNHMGLFVLDTIAALTMSAINLFFPDVLGRFVDDFIPSKDTTSMMVFGAVLVGLYLIRLGCNYFVNYYGHVMGTRIERDMRIDLFQKIQTLDSDYFDDHKTGSIMTHIVGHLRDISEMAHHTPENLIVSSIMLIGSFFILIQLHVFFTLVIFLLILGLIVFSAYRRDKMMAASRQTRQTHEEINSEVENSLGGIRLTKAFTNEPYELDKFTRVTHLYQRSFGEFYKQMGIFSSGTNLIIDLLYVVVLVYGAILVTDGAISLGDYTRFFFYLTFLIQPIRTLIMTIEQVQKGWSGYEKFYHTLQIEPKILSPEDAVILQDPRGKISFEHVTFQYETSREDILRDFNVTVMPGRKVALVGETGVGKSTISKLIPRFYDVNQGSVKVDDIDVRAYDVTSLRKHIGHVQQDVYIFYGSIRDNILYGRPDASLEDVIDAAKKAKIHDFVERLPDGYDTLVGERGVKLSGGQKQRIAIARVFLKNPPILILDEATSSLDNVTERLIQAALDELSEGRTTIVIAHRLSTIQNADEILVLGEDGIRERGTHAELIRAGGYYQSLHEATLQSA